ncbi:hAT family dimerization protein [Rhizoctonia solani AG-3 Rhs1AP]|uniref:HAT family dimerization protein n=2 Tax=Rhizoctonia solani AG-3 TaxID=1086053 RepID=A0A074RKV9_9AGAM|nr:hAT family dimerization protein [Rhizoctonia solani AG-3 Rhs1AP]KEP45348.1 hAT family dimerization protein [Rhizoctonia solani 123E]
MRPKDVSWGYFYSDGTKYKNDQSHENAWCRSEVDQKMQQLRERDKAAQYNGNIEVTRSEAGLKCDVAMKEVDPLSGKPDNLIDHLLKCSHVSSNIKAEMKKHRHVRDEAKKAGAIAKEALQAQISMVMPGATQAVDSGRGSTDISAAPGILLEKFPLPTQKEFEKDICDLFVACNFAWNALDNPIFRQFIGRWIPGAKSPSRGTISHRTLPERVAEVEDQAKKATRGGLAMGQSDGWKNIARNPVVAMMMTVRRQTHVLSVNHVGAERKTAENLLQLIKINMEEVELGYGVEWIGWCTDAGSDAQKARMLLHSEFPWLINPVCYAHQINLILGDLFKAKMDFISAVAMSQEVIKWFNNHSRALEMLHNEQLHSLRKTLALITPVLTRWTSIYMSVRRLLDCLPAFRGMINNCPCDQFQTLAGVDRKSRDKALDVWNILNNNQFWKDLTRVSGILAPLTVAAHITEGATTRLDQVALTYGNLYRIYSQLDGEDMPVGKVICESFERRWASGDQDPLILAVFFNPYIRGDLFDKASGDFLCGPFFGTVTRVWKRVFRHPEDSPPDPSFFGAYTEYYSRGPNSIFSDENMCLSMHEEIAHAQGKEVDIIQVWEALDDGSFSGRNWLVKLAIRILSVVANSAGCERLFSQMGRIHTKYRARLDLKRVRNAVVLKNSLMRQFEESPEAKHRNLKRKIRDYDEEEVGASQALVNDTSSEIAQSSTTHSLNDSNDASVTEPLDDSEIENNGYDFSDAEVEIAQRDDPERMLRTMANKLVNDALTDDAAAAEIGRLIRNAPNPNPLIHSAYFGRPVQTPLAVLFNFSPPTNHPAPPAPSGSNSSAPKRKSFDMYWRGAIRNMERRLQELELSQGLVSAQKPGCSAPPDER